MGLRENLRRSLALPPAEVLRVASPKGVQHATTSTTSATVPATSDATTPRRASVDAYNGATDQATVAQQPPETSATTAQLGTLGAATTSDYWLVETGDGAAVLVTTSPAATLDELRRWYPKCMARPLSAGEWQSWPTAADTGFGSL